MAARNRGRSPAGGDGPKTNDAKPEPADYEVGRGKPPVHSRFKPGGQGGPGRPKRSKNRQMLFEAEMESTLSLTIDGRARTISKRQLG
jgi:hypothetical protein